MEESKNKFCHGEGINPVTFRKKDKMKIIHAEKRMFSQLFAATGSFLLKLMLEFSAFPAGRKINTVANTWWQVLPPSWESV